MAMSVALGLTLAVGGMAPGVARASTDNNGTGTGTLTISKSDGNTVTGYKAIKIFKGNVENEGTADNPKWVMIGLDWANDDVKAAVESAIRQEDSSYAGTTAEDAANFLVARIPSNSYETIVSSDSFANKLTKTVAEALDDANNALTADYSITPGTATQVVEGYYLVLADFTTLPTGASATSPILLMMGDGQTLAISEKVTVPTVTKTVAEDSKPNLTNLRYADAQVGQEIPFTLTGTVAGNINTFPTYKYVFTDTLSAGLDLKVSGGTDTNGFDKGDIVVKVTNTDSTTNAKMTYTLSSGFDATYEQDAKDPTKHVLKVTFANLKAAVGTAEGESTATNPVPIDSSSVVTVEYIASLNANAVTGTQPASPNELGGNPNEVILTYTTIPNETFEGNTTSAKATVYEYALKLMKVDKNNELDGNPDTNQPLTGAQFTIQATATDEGSANAGKYLKNDGTFGATTLPATTAPDYQSYLFTTAGADGSFTVKGLDGGTYTINEVVAPTDYKALTTPLVLTLDVSREGATQLPQGVTTSLSGGENDGVDTTEPKDGTLDKGTRASFNSSTGTVTVVATNQKEEQLPITGLPGITMVYVVGGVILVTSLAVIVRRRVHEKE